MMIYHAIGGAAQAFEQASDTFLKDFLRTYWALPHAYIGGLHSLHSRWQPKLSSPSLSVGLLSMIPSAFGGRLEWSFFRLEAPSPCSVRLCLLECLCHAIWDDVERRRVGPSGSNAFLRKRPTGQHGRGLAHTYATDVRQQTPVLIHIKDVYDQHRFMITIRLSFVIHLNCRCTQTCHPGFQPLSSLLRVVLMTGRSSADLLGVERYYSASLKGPR